MEFFFRWMFFYRYLPAAPAGWDVEAAGAGRPANAVDMEMFE